MVRTPLLLLLAVTFAISAPAATIPFFDNFDSYDNTTNPTIVPTGFSESPGSLWNVRDDGAGNDYEFAVNQVDGSGTITTSLRTANVTLTNVVGTSFTISANMTIDAASGSGSANNDLVVGLQFLGTGGFSPGYTAEIDVLGSGLGTIRVSENDTPRISGSITGTLVASTTYLLTATGTYSGGNLDLLFTISGSGVSGSVSFLDTTPQTGQLFGFRNLTTTGSGGSVVLDVDYDNFSVAAVPEPSAFLLSGAGVFALLTRRHRRR